jgi:peptidoglycan/xylan/chitin deacetylase (PgdA/CDA1 family)
MAALALLGPRASAQAGETRGPATPILVYHRFGPVAADSMTVTTPVFEEQLRWLDAHGWRVIPLRELVAWLAGEGPAPPERSVVITVDDGHRTVHSDMLPVVARRRVPVTLFVYPSAISNASYALTWQQLGELAATGLFDVQSHSLWHPNFAQEQRRLPAAEYERLVATQLEEGRRRIEERLGNRVDLLAWPFGIHDEALEERAARAGYTAAFGLERRAARRGDALLALPRLLVGDRDRGAAFARLLGAADPPEAPEARLHGRILDAATRAPLEDAIVTRGGAVVRTGADGGFDVAGAGDQLLARAIGHGRAELDLRAAAPAGELALELPPLSPKALYLSSLGAGNARLREAALALIADTELDALVIDVKGDRGLVAYRSEVPLAAEVGAQKVLALLDAPGLLARLRALGIYTIARIVVFKDDPLARARPELAVRRRDGQPWRDREGLAWTDPSRREAWAYNVDLAVEAARLGFDEIQFDYVRFPDAGGLVFAAAHDEPGRVAAIAGFLAEARERLAPYNVFVAADVFGYVCWNENDTQIGQRLEALAPHVDYLSPMLYPSGFQYGIPGVRNPVAHPFEIVRASLARARERTGLPPQRFRPWLQAFRDYAFDHRPFGGDAVRAQIRAAEEFGANGWMLWNPRNLYAADGLRPAIPTRAEAPE